VEDQLAYVTSVSPAFVKDLRVSTDGIFNCSHLLITAESVWQDPIYLLVCMQGWRYLRRMRPPEKKSGGPSFAYSVKEATHHDLLSVGDRKMIVMRVLEHFVGRLDWKNMRPWDVEVEEQKGPFLFRNRE
jgi:hypothetical protein